MTEMTEGDFIICPILCYAITMGQINIYLTLISTRPMPKR